jgi:murein DD-endopeptidase MepM/ murein hydrolase activator NlpD
MMMRKSGQLMQPSKDNRTPPLIVLGLWISSIGLLPMGLISQPVRAEDLVIPEGTVETAPAVPETPAFVEPIEPAAIAEPEPVPADLAPETVVPSAASTDMAPPTAVVEPVAPAPSQAQSAQSGSDSDPYIDTRDYSVGATGPYSPPEQIVIDERNSGCQASLAAGQAIANSLCGGPSTAASGNATTSSPSLKQPAAWADRWAAPVAPASTNTWESSEPITAQTVQNTLQQRTVKLPRNLALKPLTGSNPLRWLLNGERMIFPLPIPVDITSAFGWRMHPISGTWRFHSGTDLGAPMGTPVLAAYSGRVSLAEFLGGYGLSILLDHNEGNQETRYAHLSEVFVKPGQWVQQGTVIGLVGSTGHSTGPHLHFEALQNSAEGMVAVDPGVELEVTLAQLVQALQTARVEAPTKTDKTQLQADS